MPTTGSIPQMPSRLRLRLLCIVGALGAIAYLPNAQAQKLSLNRAIVEFESNQRFQDVVVVNRDTKRQFVEVQLYAIPNPGGDEDGHERRVELTPSPSSEIIVSPRKLVIPAGERRTVRFIDRHKKRDSEKIYRAVVRPINPPAEGQEPNTIGVNVVVAYGVLLVVRPNEPIISLRGERTGRKLVVTNTGNVNVVLTEGEQCQNGTCSVTVKGERIYPGKTWEQELPIDAPVTYSYKVGSDNRAEIFN